MKINHELIRKFLRFFGISLFAVTCFFKFKKLIESGGKEMEPEPQPQEPDDYGEAKAEQAPTPTNSYDNDDEDL